MFIHYSPQKGLLLLVLSSSLLAFSGCSPKIKIGLWAKTHQDAAVGLGIWSANNPIEATVLLNLDCSDRKQFKQKITNALNGTTHEQQTRQNGYDVRQHNYHYGSASAGEPEYSFADWCRKYPKAARKLRSHAKALCKAGIGILNGTYKIR